MYFGHFSSSKAFDKLCHSAILKCMQERRTPLWLLKIIANWLRDHTFQVRVGENGRSSWKEASSGAPKGAGLSAVLFICVMDGIFNLHLNDSSKLILYADDIALVGQSETALDCQRLQEDLSKIRAFLTSVGLSLNPAKSSILGWDVFFGWEIG